MNNEALERFYEKLAKTTERWVVMPNGHIRTARIGNCPLSEINYAEERALSPIQRQSIINAADNCQIGENIPQIRARMLQILNLQEQS